jgi:hypothetical protein
VLPLSLVSTALQINRLGHRKDMNLRAHSELDNVIEPAAALPTSRRSAARALVAKSLVKVNVISINIILLIGKSG